MKLLTKSIEDTVKLFKVLCNETRLSIIALLAEGERCVNSIAKNLKLSQSTISHQLKNMRYLDVVKTRRDGKQVFYSLKDEQVKDMFEVGYKHAND